MIQSVIIKKTMGLKKAIDWIKTHGYTYGKMDETQHFYRFRQMNPSPNFEYATKQITPEIELVLAFPHSAFVS